MHITEHIAKRKRPLVSVEITPPEKGRSVQEIFNTVDQLVPFQPTFITVTYHQQRIVYQELGAGLVKRVPRRKNPGTVGICAAIANRYKSRDRAAHHLRRVRQVRDRRCAWLTFTTLGSRTCSSCAATRRRD